MQIILIHDLLDVGKVLIISKRDLVFLIFTPNDDNNLTTF